MIRDKSKAVDIYLEQNDKSPMYELIGKELIKSIRKDDNKVGLSQSIIDVIRNEFRQFRKNHDSDEYKIPFSDSSLQAISLSTFTSTINTTAIKKKHPGIGAVLIPGYNVFQNFRLNGEVLSYDDLYEIASQEGITPEEYLNRRQLEIESQPPLPIDQLNIEDIIEIKNEDGTFTKFVVDNVQTYQYLKDNFTEFYPVVTQGQNLKPVQINWNAAGKHYNLYDLPAIQEAIQRRSQGNLTKQEDLVLQKNIQNSFRALHDGFMPLTKDLLDTELETSTLYGFEVIPITDLVNKPAEIMLSKTYASKFNIDDSDTISTIKRQGVQYFIDKYISTPETYMYDLAFTKANGNNTYIIFDSSDIDNLYEVSDDDDNLSKIGDSVYRINDDGNRLYKVKEGDLTLVKEYKYKKGDKEILILKVDDPTTINSVYRANDYDSVLVREPSPIIDSFLELNSKNSYLANLIGKNEDEVNAINSSRINYLANKQYTSFLKSLEFTASRIPAQTLQSFMKMEVVQYMSGNSNSAVVPPIQIWLQGSDYDIDKVYLMGYDFNENGQYIG